VADNSHIMAEPAPAVLALVKSEPSAAADAALVAAIPHLDLPVQTAVLALLLERGNTPRLATLVGGFKQYDERLQSLLLEKADDLEPAVRAATEASALEHREGAIEFIASGKRGAFTELLLGALRSDCRKTKEWAAAALHRMAGQLADQCRATVDAEKLAVLQARRDRLADVLHAAVMRWELHFQPKVLQAALGLGDRGEAAVAEKLREPRTKLGLLIGGMLTGACEPGSAAFALRALAIPELRATAAQTIAAAPTPEFRKALAEESWLLADSRVEQGCRLIRSGPWTDENIDEVVGWEGRQAAAAIRFLGVTGTPDAKKIELWRRLLDAGDQATRSDVVWQLIPDRSPAATNLLAVLASRSDGSVSDIAERELRRRRPNPALTPSGPAAALKSSKPPARPSGFDEFWRLQDAAPGDPDGEWSKKAQSDVRGWLVGLRSKLASSSALDRTRALRALRTLGLVAKLAEQVYALAFDQDAGVRSQAVAMLAELPGLTSQRILRVAVSDPDVRVQANAVEVMDVLNATDRAAYTVEKLESPHGRVRANAVKSLLRLEVQHAGEVLLDMLRDPSAAQRVSALWVVERLGLQALLHRVVDMSRSDSDPRVRKRATRAMASLTGTKWVESEPPPSTFDRTHEAEASE